MTALWNLSDGKPGVAVALADLDAAIGRAERSRTEQLAELELLARAGKGTAGILAWLRRTNRHLGALRGERQRLLTEGDAARRDDR